MVRIIKCSGVIKGAPEYWYRNMIGKEFEIHENEYSYNKYYFWVKTEKGINVVNVNDAKII